MLLYSVWKNLFHLLHMGDILVKCLGALQATHDKECNLENVFWYAKAKPQSSLIMDTILCEESFETKLCR